MYFLLIFILFYFLIFLSMWIPETPENPDQFPKGKPQLNFASNLVTSILLKAKTGNGLSLRNKETEAAILAAMEEQFKEGDELWIVNVGYRIIDYTNELFLGGDVQGAKEFIAWTISRTLIEQMKELNKD